MTTQFDELVVLHLSDVYRDLVSEVHDETDEEHRMAMISFLLGALRGAREHLLDIGNVPEDGLPDGTPWPFLEEAAADEMRKFLAQ